MSAFSHERIMLRAGSSAVHWGRLTVVEGSEAEVSEWRTDCGHLVKESGAVVVRRDVNCDRCLKVNAEENARGHRRRS